VAKEASLFHGDLKQLQEHLSRSDDVPSPSEKSPQRSGEQDKDICYENMKKKTLIEGINSSCYENLPDPISKLCHQNYHKIAKRNVGHFSGGKAEKGVIIEDIKSQLEVGEYLGEYLKKNMILSDGKLFIIYKNFSGSERTAITKTLKKFGWDLIKEEMMLCLEKKNMKLNRILMSGEKYEAEYARTIMFNGQDVGKAKVRIDGPGLAVCAVKKTEVIKLKKLLDAEKMIVKDLPKITCISFATGSNGKNSKGCGNITVRLGFATEEEGILAKSALSAYLEFKKEIEILVAQGKNTTSSRNDTLEARVAIDKDICANETNDELDRVVSSNRSPEISLGSARCSQSSDYEECLTDRSLPSLTDNSSANSFTPSLSSDYDPTTAPSIDSGVDPSADPTEFEIGDKVIRKNRMGEVVKVDHTLIPPTYDVRMDDDGSVVNTEFDKLTKVPTCQNKLIHLN